VDLIRREVTMPTEIDVKLAENLANFRVEVAECFGAVAKDLARVETKLGIIRKLGTWLLGGFFGVVAALVTGAATIGWSASAVVAEVKNQAQRTDKLENRLDAMAKQLEILIRRSEPKAGG
jgi:hypothetical protein